MEGRSLTPTLSVSLEEKTLHSKRARTEGEVDSSPPLTLNSEASLPDYHLSGFLYAGTSVSSTEDILGGSSSGGSQNDHIMSSDDGGAAGGGGVFKAEAEFAEEYSIGRQLGRGAFSSVFECTHRHTGEQFAVKMIDLRPLRLRTNFSVDRLLREVRIQRRLHHANIVQLHEVFGIARGDENLLIVMELAPGTELFDTILARNNFSERDALPIFVQIASALNFLHEQHNVIHRDVKPENILVLDATLSREAARALALPWDEASPPSYPTVKLLDFGLAKSIGDGDSRAKTFVGTPCYLAPEIQVQATARRDRAEGSNPAVDPHPAGDGPTERILAGMDGESYTTKVDCWSLGGVLHVMLVARFPEFFELESTMDLSSLSPAYGGGVSPSGRPTHLHFGEVFNQLGVSESAKSLIVGLMAADSRQRLSMRQALMHPWVRQGLAALPPVSRTQPPPVLSSGEGVVEPVSSTSVPGGLYRPTSSTSRRSSTTSNYDPPEVEDGGDTSSDEEGDRDLLKKKGAFERQPPPGHTPAPAEKKKKSCSEIALCSMMKQQCSTTGQGATQECATADKMPLMELQASIAHCLQSASAAELFQSDDDPVRRQAARYIRRSALACRAQVGDSLTLLRKIEQTASSVLDIFPDLELAVQEGEPDLARDFFEMVKTWMSELGETVGHVQQSNRHSMEELHCAVSAARSRQADGGGRNAEQLDSGASAGGTGDSDVTMGMAAEAAAAAGARASEKELEDQKRHALKMAGHELDKMLGKEELDTMIDDKVSCPVLRGKLREQLRQAGTGTVTGDDDGEDDGMMGVLLSSTHTNHPPAPPTQEDAADKTTAIAAMSRPEELLLSALDKLKQVDGILQQMSTLWMHTEVIFTMLHQKGQIAERFVKYAHNDRLRARFQERLGEYREFWAKVQTMARYMIRSAAASGGCQYKFLDQQQG